MKNILSQKKGKYHHMKANAVLYDQLEDDGFTYQLIEEVLHVAASPKTIHQEILMMLINKISQFLEQRPTGKLYCAPYDVELNDKNIYQPDLLFVSNERFNIIKEKRVVGTPDLVIEILSESTEKLDKEIKYKVYQEFGVKEYWIVDPEKQGFLFYQLKDKKYIEIPCEKSYSSQVLKSFIINPSVFWKKI